MLAALDQVSLGSCGQVNGALHHGVRQIGGLLRPGAGEPRQLAGATQVVLLVVECLVGGANPRVADEHGSIVSERVRAGQVLRRCS